MENSWGKLGPFSTMSSIHLIRKPLFNLLLNLLLRDQVWSEAATVSALRESEYKRLDDQDVALRHGLNASKYGTAGRRPSSHSLVIITDIPGNKLLRRLYIYD